MILTYSNTYANVYIIPIKHKKGTKNMSETLTSYTNQEPTVEATATPEVTATDNNEVEFRVPNSEEIARSIGESSVAAATISGLLEPRIKHELAPGYNYADHIK